MSIVTRSGLDYNDDIRQYCVSELAKKKKTRWLIKHVLINMYKFHIYYAALT